MRRACRKIQGAGRFFREERGSQVLELAVVMPILLLLIGATAELGRFFYTYSTLVKSTMVGARYLSTKQTVTASDSDAINVVLCGNAAGCGGAGQPSQVIDDLAAGNVVITPPDTSAAVAYVTVEISGYNYTPIIDLGKMVGSETLSLSVPMNARTRMRYK